MTASKQFTDSHMLASYKRETSEIFWVLAVPGISGRWHVTTKKRIATPLNRYWQYRFVTWCVEIKATPSFHRCKTNPKQKPCS